MPNSGGTSAGSTEVALTAAEISRQVAQANALRVDLARTNAQLASVVAKLDELGKQSNALLDQLATAKEQQADAQADLERNQALMAQLNADLIEQRQLLRAWAFAAYSEGAGSLSDMVGVFDALGHADVSAGNPAGDMAYLTDSRAQVFQRIRDLTQQQAEVTIRAQAAQTRAADATATMTKAKAELDKVLAAQTAQMDALKKVQADQLAKAGPLVGILAGAVTPAAKAAFDGLLAELTKNGQSLQSIGALCSKDDGAYPNGMLPASALCPLFKAPGQSLRPRAAAAFNALSTAYAKATGSPICVTDSYRSLADQYAVKASRGRWAATPGYSPHGLGIAVDLCGGINSFGSPAYDWMRQNGPSYGWYHPAWAEPGGSLPEPWHWQFAG